MSPTDHPARAAARASAADAVLAAAGRLVDELTSPSKGMREFVDAEDGLVNAVQVWRHLTVDTSTQWRGPGVYSLTVVEPNGDASGGNVASRTLTELADHAVAMGATSTSAVLAEWNGPILGTPQR